VLSIEAKATGARRALAPQWGFPLPTEWAGSDGLTLRDLITRVVREQVRAFGDRQAEARLLRVLTEREIETGTAAGRIVPGGRPLRQRVDPDVAVGVALQAFEDGLYLTLIDGVQYHRLEEAVPLSGDSTVTFVRLVALAGG
jgi:hypothetical protein